MSQSPSYVASEDILPCKFVNIVAGTDHQIEACAADALADGVIHESTQDAALPGVLASALPAAKAGTSCRVYGLGELCEVVASETIAAGDYLKPDANGNAAVCTSADTYSAKARGGAASGEKCQVYLERGVTP
jgi:hypothetical protein